MLPKDHQPHPLNGRWFFTQCAMGFEDASFFLNINVNGQDNYQSKALPYETLYSLPTPIVSNNNYFRQTYRSGDSMTVTIKNAATFGTQFFMKNLYVFREFIPFGLKFQHFSIQDIVSASPDWPELLYVIPFQTFTYGGTYTVTSTSYILPGGVNTITVSMIPVSTPNLYPPINFRTLNLITTANTQYTTADLENTVALAASGNQKVVFADNKALTCNTNYWMDLTSTGSSLYSCNSDCPSGNTMYPGVTLSKGYCNYPCTGSMNCPYQNSSLANLPTSFTCVSGATNIYYTCATVATPNYYGMIFNSFYTPANIYIDSAILPNFQSYTITIWYMADNVTVPNTNFLTAPAGSPRNYVFYSNSMKLYINTTNYLYYLEMAFAPTNPTDVTAWINLYEWNKLCFNVIYDGTNYNFQFITRNQVSTPVTLNPNTYTNSNQSLSYILFCHLDVSSCHGYSVYWASGFYRNMKIWNGDISQPFSNTQYEIIYSAYASRPYSIQLHFPLSQTYITTNTLSDPLNTSNNFVISNSWNLVFGLPTYNYNNKNDYIQSTSNFGSYMSNILNNVVTMGTCATGCTRCYGTSSSQCSVCSTGYFLVESSCRSASPATTYFTSPSLNGTPNPIYFNNFNSCCLPSKTSPQGTITFWAKVFGFSNKISDMIWYSGTGSSNMRLSYDSTSFGSNSNYGLSLIYNSGTPGTTVANLPTFRTFFGQWTFFSLAFYYNSSNAGFYPPMVSFEINSTSLPILSFNGMTNWSLAQFSIRPSLYGLVSSIKAYSTYIVGAYGFETNAASPTSPASRPSYFVQYIPPGIAATDCLAASSQTSPNFTDSYVCSNDYNFLSGHPINL